MEVRATFPAVPDKLMVVVEASVIGNAEPVAEAVVIPIRKYLFGAMLPERAMAVNAVEPVALPYWIAWPVNEAAVLPAL